MRKTPLTATNGRQNDRAYEELRRMIVHTELIPGEPIEERVLIERLGMGRTPIREALQRLIQDKLVRSVPRRGFFVTETTSVDLVNLFEIRTSLESLSAYLAAQRATTDHYEQFEELLGVARQGIDEGNEDLLWNLELDEWFHGVVADAAGNDYLAASIKQYYGLSVRMLYRLRVQMTMVRDEIENYTGVFHAIMAGDPRLAETAMRKHIGKFGTSPGNGACAPPPHEAK
jgi:DNA-binding GntR family transcriptional regulator